MWWGCAWPVAGSVLRFTIETPVPNLPHSSLHPWRQPSSAPPSQVTEENVMEKLGVQLLGSATFNVKHKLIPLETDFSRTW